MEIDFGAFACFLIIGLIGLPVILKAQAERQGNHCAVQKSPFRLSMDSGKVVYINQCSSCHQADGHGDSTLNPPLNSQAITGNKKDLIEIVINGLNQHADINGKIYQNAMPPNPKIKDQEVADVLTYIRNSFGNKASAVKVSEVRSVRSKLK
jgi:mono/diheme cytochrome c family protein